MMNETIMYITSHTIFIIKWKSAYILCHHQVEWISVLGNQLLKRCFMVAVCSSVVLLLKIQLFCSPQSDQVFSFSSRDVKIM